MNDEKNKIVADRIQKLIDDNSMTRKEFSERLGISPAMLSYYLRGTKMPSVKVMNAMVNEFNVSIDWILGNENSTEKLQTYADVIRLVLPLLDCNMWEIFISGGERHNGFTGIMEYDTPECNIRTLDPELINFFENYIKMESVLKDNAIPREVYDLWINDRMEYYQKIPLPDPE